MLQNSTDSSIEDLAMKIIRCYAKRELDEKINAWRGGRAIVNIYDITRCGYRYKLSINNPEPALDNISKEDVFRRYIINYGVTSSIGKAYEDEDAKIQENLRYTLTVDNKEVELVGICDIFLPREKEVILIRHVKELKDGEPKKHHVEQAVVLQWLAYKNDILVKPRILYYIGFVREFKEFTIDTSIAHSSILAKDGFEKRLIKRLRLLLGGEGPFSSWECEICPYKSYCDKKQGTNAKTPQINSIISEGEWIWYEDILLTRTAKFIKKLIERDIELAEFYEKKDGNLSTSSNLRVSVTKLTGCPIKFWFSTLIPYTTILSKLSKRVLRGIIVHSGIAYIISKINEVKQYCTDLDSISRCIKDIEVEKKLSKNFSIYGYNIEVSGRADIILHYVDNGEKNVVIELKTAEEYSEAKSYHEEQLKIYLNMLKNSKGKLVYITEAKEKTSNSKEQRKVLKFNEIYVDKPVSDDHIKDRLKDIIRVKEGLIDVSGIAEKYGNLCRMCEFKDLCTVGNLLTKRKTETTKRNR